MNSVKWLLVVTLSIFFNANNAVSKELKPQVLVYGDNVAAFSAAVQSAKSNVPTVWVIPSSTYCAELFLAPNTITAEDNLTGGIWMNVLQEMLPSKEKNDSLFTVTKNNIDFLLLQKALDNILANQSNLTIIKNVSVVKLVNSKKDIEIVLSNKSKYKVRSAVDATPTAVLRSLVVQNNKLETTKVPTTGKDYSSISTLSSDEIRAILAIGESDKQIYAVTLNQLLSKASDNLFFTNEMSTNISSEANSIPFQFNIGQAVGACAAYCAFFKTTSYNIDVRKVQTELLSFDVRILPFVDINIEDTNFNALQKMFLVNILSWNKDAYPYEFESSDSVSIVSVKPIIQQLYSRAQLWFVDNKSEYFTVKDAVELIKVLAFRGDELDAEIEKAWKRRFKFKREFDLSQNINRYEFAVLLNAYADPFVKRVSIDGVIQQ